MYAYRQLIRRSMQAYQDSVINGDPNLRFLADAVLMSLVLLERDREAQKVARDCNGLWYQMMNSSSQNTRQYSKQRLTRELSNYRPVIHEVLGLVDDEDENDFTSNREYAPGVVMVIDR